MYRLADLIEENIDELAALESLDNGKPFNEARHGDLVLVLDCLRYYAGYADKIHGSTIPIRGNYLTYTRREAVGVAGQIIPWNFPMLMVAWKWGPALAAGCTIVMKPAEQTPLSCLRMAQLAKEAGIPDGVINVVPGFGPTAGASLVRHPGVDKIAFTGEHRTAQIIMRDASESLKRLTFELGGKSPNVVMADADLDRAAQGAGLADRVHDLAEQFLVGDRLGGAPVAGALDDLAAEPLDLVGRQLAEVVVERVAGFELLAVDQERVGAAQRLAVLVEVAEQR
jgi:aldehyde dehydrogenase (NAD+)